MDQIEIRYNPFTRRPLLKINGTLQQQFGGRFAHFFCGRPMEHWLTPRVISYQKWEGILPELMGFVNSDELEILFVGTETDYACFAGEIRSQHRAVENKGMCPDLYRLSFRAGWEPEQIQGRMLRVLSGWETLLMSQNSILQWEYYYGQLCGMVQAGLQQLNEYRMHFLEIADENIEVCTRTGNPRLATWKKNRESFDKLFSDNQRIPAPKEQEESSWNQS